MGEDFLVPGPPQRNASAQRAHRRETWLQIILPLVLGAALLVSLVVLAAESGQGNLGSLAQIATMLLVLPLMVVGLVMLAGASVGILALARLMGWLPQGAYRVQHAISRISQAAIRGADGLARPVLLLESWAKAAQRVFRRYN